MEKKSFYCLLFLSAVSICTGAFLEAALPAGGKSQLIGLTSAYFDAGPSFWPVFWQSLGDALWIAGACFISGLCILLLPLGLGLVLLKGLALGFSSAMAVEVFGIKGAAYAALTLAPAGFLQLLLFSYLVARAVTLNAAIFRLLKDRYRHEASRPHPTGSYLLGHYLRLYTAAILGLFLTCLLQAALLTLVG